MVTRCKNQECGYASTCGIRRADMAPAKNRVPTDDAPVLPLPAPPPKREPWRDPVQFSVLPADVGAGWIGVIDVRGRLTDSHRAILLDVADDIFSVNGLFLRLDTPGGSGLAGLTLHAMITLATQRMPVVAWARQACSAATLPLAACNAAFCHPSGALGCFGRLQAVCDGKSPRVLTSTQSPKKWDASAPMPPWLQITYMVNGDAAGAQAGLDRSYERDLGQLAGYTDTNPDRLRTYLDGRILSPRQARRIGLINGICSEDKAYEALLEMVKKSLKTNT